MYNLPSESAANIWTEQKQSSIKHPRKIVQSERESKRDIETDLEMCQARKQP